MDAAMFEKKDGDVKAELIMRNYLKQYQFVKRVEAQEKNRW